MPDYRAFVIGEDGHVSLRHEFSCATDDDAREYAKQLVDGHDVELWQLDRRIETFKSRK